MTEIVTETGIAQKEPFAVEVKAGDTYYWCRCGRSSKPPFCDGSHKETAFNPIAFTAERSTTVYFCGCMRSNDAPFCDGTHKGF